MAPQNDKEIAVKLTADTEEFTAEMKAQVKAALSDVVNQFASAGKRASNAMTKSLKSGMDAIGTGKPFAQTPAFKKFMKTPQYQALFGKGGAGYIRKGMFGPGGSAIVGRGMGITGKPIPGSPPGLRQGVASGRRLRAPSVGRVGQFRAPGQTNRQGVLGPLAMNQGMLGLFGKKNIKSMDPGPLEKLTKGLGQYGPALEKGSTAMQKFSRRLGFMAFIMSFTAKRIIDSVKGIGQQIVKTVTDFGSFETAGDKFSSALSKLAMGGLATEENVGRLMAAFQTLLAAAPEILGALGLIEMAMMDIGAAVVTGATATDEEGVLGPFARIGQAIADIFNNPDLLNSISAAVNNFLKPIAEALEGLLGDKGDALAAFGKALEDIGAILGAFSAGVIQGYIDFVTWVGVMAEEDKLEGLEKTAFWLGKILVPLTLIGVPLTLAATLFGGVALAIGSVTSGVTTLLGWWTAATAKTGVLTKALGLIGKIGFLPLTMLIATVTAYGGDLWKMFQNSLGPEIGRLMGNVMDLAGWLGTLWDWFDDILGLPFAIIFGVLIETLANILDAVNDLIESMESLWGWFQTSDAPGLVFVRGVLDGIKSVIAEIWDLISKAMALFGINIRGGGGGDEEHKCKRGMHWDDVLGKCVSDDPIIPPPDLLLPEDPLTGGAGGGTIFIPPDYLDGVLRNLAQDTGAKNVYIDITGDSPDEIAMKVADVLYKEKFLSNGNTASAYIPGSGSGAQR